MKRSAVARAIDFIFIAAGLTFVGCVVMIVTLLFGGEKFYTPLSAVITVAIIVFIGVGMFTPTREQILYRSVIGFFVLCSLTVAGYEGFKIYEANIPQVSEQEVDLQEYMPFAEQTKAKRLDQPSTLTLQGDLPRLDGATALYPLYSAFAQAVYPKKAYDLYGSEVMGNTTPDAYENLIDGKVDIIFVAGPSEQAGNDPCLSTAGK